MISKAFKISKSSTQFISLLDWFALNISLSWASSGVGTLLSLAVSRDSTYLVSIVLSLFFGAFSGLYPRYADLGQAKWIWDLSYARWSSEAVYTLYTKPFEEQGQDIQRGANEFGYTIGRFSYDLGVLWALGFAFRVVTASLLIRKVHGWTLELLMKEKMHNFFQAADNKKPKVSPQDSDRPSSQNARKIIIKNRKSSGSSHDTRSQDPLVLSNLAMEGKALARNP
ncbi:hypothetical protein AAMO2058_000344200 [Amorphochlora amoebiformis]